jgi:Protein of unknown function (DUF2000)
MRFDTKIAVIVRDDLEIWQRLNVTAFLASGLAANPDLLGKPYADADGTRYLPLFRQPVLVMEGGKEVVTTGRERAARRGAACLPRCTPPTCSPPDTTRRTGLSSRRCGAPTWTWSPWRYTASASPSTRS